jgi:small conductance mechanosensitive channel
MAEFWQQLQQAVLDYAPRLPAALIILIVGWGVVRFLLGPLRRMLDRSRLDPSVMSFVVNSARIVILLVTLLAVLHQLGIQTASLLTLLGAAGLAIALSLQSSLANFAAGLLLLSFRRVRVGDLIEVGDARGRVSEMLPFHTVLVTVENETVIIPNTSLTNGTVRNQSSLPLRRVRWTVPLGPDDALAVVKAELRRRLLADPRVHRDPAPQLYLETWSPDQRVLAITAWTATPDALVVQQDLLEEFAAILDQLRQRPAGAVGPDPPSETKA